MLSISCGVLKPQSSGTSGKYFETFFTGESGTQYFIKPLSFSNPEKSQLEMDFTFRVRNIGHDSAIVNFTISHPAQVRQCDSLLISNPQFGATTSPFLLLFSSRSKDLIKSRFRGKIPLSALKTLFENPNWTLFVYSPQGSFQFKPSSKTSKRIESVHYSVFSLM